MRYTANGSAVANISVATNETWKDKSTGEAQERTEWHRIVMFGKLAEIASQYLKKGSQAYFEGRIQTRKWQDQSGNDRYSTEIVANEMQMLGGRSGGGGGASSGFGQNMDQSQPTQSPGGASPAPASGGQDKSPAQGGAYDDFDDDIPF